MILLSIYIYNWIGNKFLQLTSSSPYKYINSINKTNQMTANVQAISIIISKLNKIMSNYAYILNIVLIFNSKRGGGRVKLINCVEILSRLGIINYLIYKFVE